MKLVKKAIKLEPASAGKKVAVMKKVKRKVARGTVALRYVPALPDCSTQFGNLLKYLKHSYG